MIGRMARVAKPDAALRLDLLKVGTAIGRKQEWHTIWWLLGTGRAKLPRAALRKFYIVGRSDRLGVTTGLVNCSLDVLALTFRFHQTDARQADKERVVGGTVGRW